MCGLIGIVSPERPIDPNALRAGLRALRHRGPDGEGSWLAPDGQAALGHTRLALVDVPGGAQPLHGCDGTQVVAVVNGELYGHEALRRELEARGHVFRTRSDSEVAVHLYEEHGDDFVHRLRGEFALVVWDGRRRRLLAARDRFGVRPLVFAAHAGALWFASEAKALFAMGVPAAWDRDAFLFASSLQYLPEGRTLFSGVSQLAAGQVLFATAGRVELRRYAELDFPRQQLSQTTIDPQDAAAELRARLDEAVRLRLPAEAKAAFQLSGGLDSSAVAGLAARHSSRPLQCFTLAFDDAAWDEHAIAARTAAHLGAELHVVHATQDLLADHFLEAAAHGEGLCINGHVAAKWLLARAVRDAGCKAVLTGEGADEVLGGYAHLRADAGLSSDKNITIAGVHLPEGEALPVDAVERALGFVPTFLQAKATLGLRVRAVLADDAVIELSRRDPYAELMAQADVAGQLAGRHRADQAAWLWSRLALAGYILRTLGDGMEMAHSIEGRLPFLDGEVWSLLRTLPASLRLDGVLEKQLLRDAARGVLTAEVQLRRKQPLMAPPITRLATPRVRALVDDTLRAGVPFFDGGRLRALVDRLPAMSEREQVAQEPVVCLALSAAALAQRYRLGTG